MLPAMPSTRVLTLRPVRLASTAEELPKDSAHPLGTKPCSAGLQGLGQDIRMSVTIFGSLFYEPLGQCSLGASEKLNEAGHQSNMIDCTCLMFLPVISIENGCQPSDGREGKMP